jgi:hypothetical protein
MSVANIKFHTAILQIGNNTGILIPPEVVDKFGAGKRPAVHVTINGYTYRNRIASLGGKFLIAVSAEVRGKASVKGGDKLEVELSLDTAPREVSLPDDFKKVLATNKKASKFFEQLPYSAKQRYVLPIDKAKTEETRKKRIEKAIEDLEDGKK